LTYQQEHGTNILEIGPSQNIGLSGGGWAFVAVEPKSGKLAVASGQRRAAITDLSAPANSVRLEQVHANANYIDLSPGGKFAATGTWNGKGVKVWDAQTGKLLHEHATKSHAAVAFSPDGRWLMTLAEECHALPVGTWTNWQLVRPFTGHQVLLLTAFSPDGRLWARPKTPTSYELVEPGTWRAVAVLESPYPIGLAGPRFSPDGALFAAADAALGVQIWDLRELRAALRPMRLDWDHPGYPAAVSQNLTNQLVARVMTK
jgi:WD40 repeat protein